MTRIFWTLRLALWLIYYRYVSWLNPLEAYRFASDADWQEYRRHGLTPHDAVLEDLSYA